MILLDTGPIVAIFNPKDDEHEKCINAVKKIDASFVTTIPVLCESIHLLGPGSQEVNNLLHFISLGGSDVWHMDHQDFLRTCTLMKKYADHLMDLANASLVAAAEKLKVFKIFTLDRQDFRTYRPQKGHHFNTFELII